VEKSIHRQWNAKKKNESKKSLYKEIALIEAQITRMSEFLSDQIEATKENIEKKQARSYRELEDELEAGDEVESDSESDSEEKPIWNPKNLPLGWDGKPIPYWLYKLNGLGIEYKCEICGDYSYWGRRAWERHFQEWRHAHAMRCLGIPNTRHFHEISKMNEARALYEKLKKEAQEIAWKPNSEEEFEDTTGNILNKKTFEDLRREGLL